MRERDKQFLVHSERFRDQLLHQGSIGCFVPSQSESEALRVWRRCVQVTSRMTATYPVYKLVRRYACQWRSVSWSPHFYDLVSVVDKWVEEEIYSWRDVSFHPELRIVINHSAPAFAICVPVAQTQSVDVFTSLDSVIALPLKTITYEFPQIKGQREVSFGALKLMSGDVLNDIRRQFVRESEMLIEQHTQVAHSRTVDFGSGLPRLRGTWVENAGMEKL